MIHANWNRNLGRTAELETNEIYRRDPYTDTKVIRVPSFIENVVKSQFGRTNRKNPGAAIAKEDIVLDSFLNSYDGTPLLGNLFKLQDTFYDALYAKGSSMLSLDKHRLGYSFMSYASANKKEIAKRQILVGSSLKHHNLSFGDHFVHKEVPSYFQSVNWDWVKDAAKFFRQFTDLKRKNEFTVPIGTSQGLLLKSEADGPLWRTVSKGLQAALALKAQNYNQFILGCNQFDEVHESRGFYGPSKSYFLGLRRQHSVKQEVIDDDSYNHPSYPADLNCSVGVQGRARGIFPPSEYAKVYFKPFSEGLKYALFRRTDVCNVSQHMIAAKLSYIKSMTSMSELYDDKTGKVEGWLTFYDLSGYDTCTHAGCGEIYDSFCRYAFDNWDTLEGDHFKDFNIVFPLGLGRHSPICSQEVKNRSTQSGQPDVTVKNNVVHLLLLSHCISYALKTSSSVRNYEPLVIFKQLISGEGPVKDLAALMHGDDAAIYFSELKDDYYNFYDEMTRLGIVTSSEMYSIYLKKTPHLALSSDHIDKDVRDLSLECINYSRGRITSSEELNADDPKLMQYSLNLWRLIDKCDINGNSDFQKAILEVKKDELEALKNSDFMHSFQRDFKLSYESAMILNESMSKITNSEIAKSFSSNADPICGMQGMTGSLARNRFGEYGTKDIVIHILSLSDTWAMLPSYTPLSQRWQWLLMMYFAFRSEKGKIAFMTGYFKGEDYNANLFPEGHYAASVIKSIYGLIASDKDGDRLEVFTKMLSALQDHKFRVSLLSCVTFATIHAQTKAKQLRGYLDRLYYTSGEQFLDSELEQIYGSIQYDPEDLSSRLGLADKSFDEILAICLKFQNEIFDSQGKAPTVFDDISVDNLKHILKYQ